MNQTNKYYIPDIEDIRVGYEFELKTPSGYLLGKFPEILEENKELDEYNDSLMKFAHAITRTPYLTKEQMDKDKFYDFIGMDDEGAFQCKTQKSGVEYMLHWTTDSMLRVGEEVTLGNNSTRYTTIYMGTCRCINEFRIICKLLNIK